MQGDGADGKWVLFPAQEVNLEENTKKSHLWIVPVGRRRSTAVEATTNEEERPRFSPDGKRVIFTSKATDPSHIWMCGFDSEAALSGTAQQVASLSTGADGAIRSPDGKNILFVFSVESRLQRRRLQPAARWGAEEEQSEGSALHPPFSLGGQDMYTISPDGQEVAYTSNIDEVEATSTNNEIFLMPIAGGTLRKISTSGGAGYVNDSSGCPVALPFPLLHGIPRLRSG